MTRSTTQQNIKRVHPAHLPPQTIITESASEAHYDINGDGRAEITHCRRTGRTLIRAALHAPAIPRTVFKRGAVFHHRETPEGLEVNVKSDTGAMVSESRHTITERQEEDAEISHAISVIALASAGTSVCGTADLSAGGLP